MDRLSLHETAGLNGSTQAPHPHAQAQQQGSHQQQQGQGQQGEQQQQQRSQQGMLQPYARLPPQMFTTAAQLLDMTDKKLVLVLRDGRKLIGVLRSWDQFANLVLQDTIERTFVRDMYADLYHGVFLARGENVLLLGEIDLDRDDYIPPAFHQVTPDEIKAAAREEAEAKRRAERLRSRKLAALGFEVEVPGDVIL